MLVSSSGLHTATIQIPNEIPEISGSPAALLNLGIASFVGSPGAKTISFIAAKLEIGSTQTLAHQENGTWVLNELPDYDEQWTKCRKYLITSTWDTGDYLAGYGNASNATTVNVYFPIGGMVKNPTISPTTGSNWILRGNGQSITPTEISSWFASTNVLGVKFTASGLTANQIYVANSNSATLVTFSAEP